MGEQVDIQLIIDDKDVIVKRLVKGHWTEKNNLNGVTFTTSLELDGATAYTHNKKPIPAVVQSDRHTVVIKFPNPILHGQTYFYELSLLLNAQYILTLGGLRIIEWPKEDLGQILLLPQAGKLFFSSALGKVIVDPRTQYRYITPGIFARKLVSHARKASGIRIEWGAPPHITLQYTYHFTNRDRNPAENIIFSTHIPPTTKFQKAEDIKCDQISRISTDEDENIIVEFQIGSLAPRQEKVLEFSITVTPLGNLSVIMPNFGSRAEYDEVTQPNTVGARMLAPSKYWALDTPKLRELVAVIGKNAVNASELIKLAFEFTNQRLTYELNGVRNPAANVIETRRGDCSEFSDLFVALLRASRIPAKVVHGWTVDPQTKVLTPHAWCEFFSPKWGWVASDPTWGFLAGVSCQHICRHREGILVDQHSYAWTYRGDCTLTVSETVQVLYIE